MIGKNVAKNTLTIAFHVLFAKKEKAYPAYVSKLNLKSKNQVIHLMIPNRRMALYCSKNYLHY